MRSSFRLIFLAVSLSFLPGCKQYFFWGKESFVQAPKVRIDVDAVRLEVQTKRLYDQAATIGIFDALFLSSSVRNKAAELVSYWKAFSEEEEQELKNLDNKEQEEALVFYLLVGNTDAQRLSLKPDEPGWSVFLTVGSQKYKPSQIKQVDLPPAYKKIFGARANHFRIPYKITFDRYTDGQADLLSNQFSLVLTTVNYTVTFNWPQAKQDSYC